MTKPSEHGVARFVTGPLGIFPIALIVAVTTDALIEGRFNMILPPRHVSFLRGSDDFGCSNLFAGATALYVVFGFLASWYLTILLSESEPSASALQDFARALWVLKFHLAAFVLGGYMFSEGGGCDQLYGNDFRNTFLLAGVVYVLTICAAVVPYRLGWSEVTRGLFGPTAIMLWLVVGADGMTPKNWQYSSGGPVTVKVTSHRQALMKRWYELCEQTLGSGTKRYR